MATRSSQRVKQQRVLFARVGWMRFYSGPVPGDERPVGGGRFNKSDIGHEVYNFKESDGQLYGYFQPTMSSLEIALQRIDPGTADEEQLNRVLVIFVARRPEGGQVIVGWYRDAEVLRNEISRSPGKPRGYGHFCSAKRKNCVLLPEEKRRHLIPFGKGGMGQSNVCYPYLRSGVQKQFAWIREAIDYVDEYDADDLLIDPQADAEKESADAAERAFARSEGQGFARSFKERRALEAHAMSAAARHFRRSRYDVEDVSARRSYDLLCKRKNEELHIEVKGTTTSGSAIVLTRNEVRHAGDPKNTCVLFVLHSIRLLRGRAVGGTPLIVDPWSPLATRLTPMSYTYRLR